MSLSALQIETLATELLLAEKSRIPIEPLTSRFPTLSEEDAYAIQLCNAKVSMSGGAKLLGYKIGLTSREAQKQFNIDSPDFGHLFSHMLVPDNGEALCRSLIQPKVEGEVAFLLGSDLKGPGIEFRDVEKAVKAAMVCMEIVDSRIRDWKIKAQDTIADNGSSALFVLSKARHTVSGLSLPNLGIALSKGDEVLMTGAGAAVMGHPLNALVFLANELGKQGVPLKEGQIVLSGSLTAMVSVCSGDTFTCEMEKLGKVGVAFR